MAGALAVFGIALAPSAGATSTATGDRIAGTNRYGTAAAIAGQPEFTGATTAILATGENFPDALAASGLAGKNTPSPIVLTQRATFTKEAQDALKALKSLKNVIIVGGTSAVSDSVKNAVAAAGYTVTRVAGNDRYETAAAIANQVGASSVGSVGGKKTALIANGENFPDALAGGPAAYKNKMPILLVHPGSVPASTAKALQDLGIKHSIILGGTAAVSDATKAAIDTATGGDSERLADVNRFGTAVKVATFELTTLGFDGKEILLANGQNFPDALAGGPLGGDPRPIYLVTPTTLPPETAAACDANSKTVNKVIALGGTAAVGANVLADCVTAAKNTSNDTGVNGTATTRPELVSAKVTETRTASAATATRPAGTYVQYCFDEPITGGGVTGGNVDAPKFHLYNSDGTRFSGTQTQTDPGPQTFTSNLDTTDNKCANVIFPALNTATLAASLTLATVERGATSGASGAGTDTNVEGDSALTPASSAPAAAGVTAAPDLLSINSTFRAGSTGDLTAVDFVFDVAAFVQNVNGFHIVDTNGVTYLCTASNVATDPSGQAAPGGSGTTTITTNCQEPAGFPGNFSSANFARGYVDAAAVGTTGAGANPNPLEAADISNGGNTGNPDLGSVIFAPDAVVGADAVAFIYDEAVSATITAGRHAIYSTAGTENNAAACGRSSDNNSVVTCLFADNTLSGANYVGGNVRAGAVFGADDNAANAADEVGTSPSAGPTTTTGRTDGPDLTAVAINTTTNAFGNTVYSATYTFDEDTAAAASAATTTTAAAGGNGNNGEVVILAMLHLYTSDGIRLDCSSLSGGLGTGQDTNVLAARAADKQNQVTCTNYTVGGTGGAGGNGAGAAATPAQIHNALVGTVEYGAVADEAAGGDVNPEGAELATGSGGTAAT